MRRGHAAALAIAMGLGVARFTACVSLHDPEAISLTHAQNILGKGGGSVTVPSGAGVTIPPGALSSDTLITMDETPYGVHPAGGTVVGTPYTFGPEGKTFAVPITITLDFDPTRIPAGRTAADVIVYAAPASSTAYDALATTQVDATHVAAHASHFSVFVAFVPEEPPVEIGPPDASTDAGQDAPAEMDSGADAVACVPRTCARAGAQCGGAGVTDASVEAAVADAGRELTVVES